MIEPKVLYEGVVRIYADEDGRYPVFPECRERIEQWLAEGRGVKAWVSMDLSCCSKTPVFSPALDKDGKDFPKPHWRYGCIEVITDRKRFRFAKELKEVLRKFYKSLASRGFLNKDIEERCRKIRSDLAAGGRKIVWRTFTEGPYNGDVVWEEVVWED